MTAPVSAGTAVYAVFGIRFLDYATERVVGGQLSVTIRPVTQLDRPVPGVVGPSGLVSFHHIPGLHNREFPLTLPRPLPSAATYLVTVEDKLGWFLPELFLIELPLPEAGSFPSGADTPLIDAYVFSSPTRPVPLGFGAIRADIRDKDTEEPIAHAVMRATVGGSIGIGITDRQGRTLVLFSTPTVDRLRLGSPPGTGQAALGPQTWQADVKAFALTGLGPPSLAGGKLPPPWGDLPTLKSILDGQPQARIALTPGSLSDSWSSTLTYGEELVLRTASSSYLSISRGASPP
jgi:hypothetical protein